MQEISGMMGKKRGKGARGVEKGTYYVYILRCRDGSLYTGLTNDLPRRWALHVSGRGAKYTRAHPPEAVAALWRCGDKSAAARLEYAIKARLTHGEKLALIAEPERAAALPGAIEFASVNQHPPVMDGNYTVQFRRNCTCTLFYLLIQYATRKF